MGVGRRIKGWLRAIAAPTVFLTLVAYFCWNATQGERGLQSYALRQGQLRAYQSDLQRVERDRDALERRVNGLRGQRLDPDMLDERSREVANVAHPDELVMLYGAGRRVGSSTPGQ